MEVHNAIRGGGIQCKGGINSLQDAGFAAGQTHTACAFDLQKSGDKVD